MFDFYGMPVYFDRFLTERVQYRFPRTRKKRIRKKWAKRAENYREIPLRVIYQVDGSIVAHPDYFREFCLDHGIEIKPGRSETILMTCPLVESRVKEELTEKRLARALSEPLGIFTNPSKESPLNMQTILDAVKEARSFLPERPAMDILGQQFKAPAYSWVENQRGSDFRYVRYEMRVPITPFLLTTTF